MLAHVLGGEVPCTDLGPIGGSACYDGKPLHTIRVDATRDFTPQGSLYIKGTLRAIHPDQLTKEHAHA